MKLVLAAARRSSQVTKSLLCDSCVKTEVKHHTTPQSTTQHHKHLHIPTSDSHPLSQTCSFTYQYTYNLTRPKEIHVSHPDANSHAHAHASASAHTDRHRLTPPAPAPHTRRHHTTHQSSTQSIQRLAAGEGRKSLMTNPGTDEHVAHLNPWFSTIKKKPLGLTCDGQQLHSSPDWFQDVLSEQLERHPYRSGSLVQPQETGHTALMDIGSPHHEGGRSWHP